MRLRAVGDSVGRLRGNQQARLAFAPRDRQEPDVFPALGPKVLSVETEKLLECEERHSCRERASGR